MTMPIEVVKPLTSQPSVTTTSKSTGTNKTVDGNQLLYPEGLPSTIPDTTDNSIDINNMSEYETLTRNRRFFNFIPDFLPELFLQLNFFFLFGCCKKTKSSG